MHKKTSEPVVKADAQADMFYLLLEEELTDAEKAAYRRGQQCEILYDAEARDDEGLPDGDRI
ncbi:MAG: hypothetical protein ACLR8P_16615 [Clostridium fessum]